MNSTHAEDSAKIKIQPVIEPHLPMLKFALFPLLLLPLFTQAETFLSLQVEDLTFEKEKESPIASMPEATTQAHCAVGHSDRSLPAHL